MTLCAAAYLKDKGICIVADSILTAEGVPATSEIIVNGQGEVIAGRRKSKAPRAKGRLSNPYLAKPSNIPRKERAR